MADGRLKRVKLAFERDFTQMPNEWLRDSHLSLKARGLLALLMSHREGYVVTYKALAATNPEGQASLVAAVQELKEQRYLVINKERGYGGRISAYVWELTDPKLEKSRSTPYLDYPDVDNPHVDKPDVDNRVLKEAHSEEYLTTNALEPDPSTRAGTNEVAYGAVLPIAPETPADRYQRLIHERCPAPPRSGKPHIWAESGYCDWCGKAMPDEVWDARHPNEPRMAGANA